MKLNATAVYAKSREIRPPHLAIATAAAEQGCYRRENLRDINRLASSLVRIVAVALAVVSVESSAEIRVFSDTNVDNFEPEFTAPDSIGPGERIVQVAGEAWHNPTERVPQEAS
jgi:hypothetical protein